MLIFVDLANAWLISVLQRTGMRSTDQAVEQPIRAAGLPVYPASQTVELIIFQNNCFAYRDTLTSKITGWGFPIPIVPQPLR